ncbi:hypothetical protein DPEC_G00171180 [Dallia pectoralis]|uniref:Uncharacterized protein n=1 Tax=Dallia pectoralis TaxID=75939 RepID=A0ACC2GDB3_DALPE|nr:hypothetical protein DPEC_G00171180 [Dallia pectoralis]
MTARRALRSGHQRTAAADFPPDITAKPVKCPRPQTTHTPRRLSSRTSTCKAKRELTYTVNERVPPRVKFVPKAAPLDRALLPFAQTRHFLSAPPADAQILPECFPGCADTSPILFEDYGWSEICRGDLLTAASSPGPAHRPPKRPPAVQLFFG